MTIKDMIVKEQLINTLPGEIRVYVKEHKPKTSQEAGELADDHIRARKSGDGKPPKDIPPIHCSRCKKLGNSEKTCRVNLKSEDGKGSSPASPPPAPPREKPKPRTDLKYITCFNCLQKDHYSSNCPQSALFCGTGTGQMAKRGQVEGKEVGDILLDTGCSRTMVHRDLVRDEKQLEGEAVTICCAHGDVSLYPLAEVDLELEGIRMQVKQQCLIPCRYPFC
jgi:predicted aspartyl protease